MLLVTSDVASCVSCYHCLQLAPHGAWGAWDNYNANGTTPLTSKTYSVRITTPTTNAAQSTVSTWGQLECTPANLESFPAFERLGRLDAMLGLSAVPTAGMRRFLEHATTDCPTEGTDPFDSAPVESDQWDARGV